MKERPILFSTKMVLAILDERKCVTRRIIKPQPEWKQNDGLVGWSWKSKKTELNAWPDEKEFGKRMVSNCPYGQVGDRLWVKETYRPTKSGYDYKADFQPDGTGKILPRTWKPSIYMPRVASRITLAIREVKVERIQDIRNVDAMLEGIDLDATMPIDSFKKVWELINGSDSWEKNVWVWVIGFRRIQ